ncbi:MAG: alpha/beta hydrolase family protein [Clostridia bacterium]|nr:alpha/beta hydrolase family protein [Clostridia bacterium]
MHVEHYYTSINRMLEIFEQEARKQALKASNKIEYELWKKETRDVLLRITGIELMEHCQLEPSLIKSERFEGFIREKWIIWTEPGVQMPFYVLIPNGLQAEEKRPVMITPHGHASGGKLATAVHWEIPAVRHAVERDNYTYAFELVKRGFIVFCPDARGFGERRELVGQGDEDINYMNSTCRQINHMAICLGRSLTGLWVWDLMRLVDYVQTRADCNPNKIGCAGLSGGGLQTLWLAALDERIVCAVVSGYFYGYRDSLLIQNDHCACNYVPGLWQQVDMGDIGALIAPRPLLVETGNVDPLNGYRGTVNASEQVEITRKAYRLLGCENSLIHHIFEGGHRWCGEKAFEFLEKHLKESI